MRVWITAAILLTAVGPAALCASPADSPRDSADSPKELALSLAKKAKRAEKQGHNAEAYIFYSQAAAIQPKNRGYHARMELSRPAPLRNRNPNLARVPNPNCPQPTSRPKTSSTA